jgi:periplasmic divalent cation tolerance protein
MTQYIQVITTTETKEQAEGIARAVVEKRLAACAQIVGPISSTYWWKGKIETAGEWMCLMKSREDLYAQLENAIREVHPYEVPEIVAMPIVAGSKDYLRWLSEELKDRPQ